MRKAWLLPVVVCLVVAPAKAQAPVKVGMDTKDWAEFAKNWAEVVGILIGGGYFLYRSSRGAFTHNLSLSVEYKRTNIDKTDFDCLAITTKLSKGDRYTVELHDAVVRITRPRGDQTSWPPVDRTLWPPKEAESRFWSLSELHRKHTKSDDIQARNWEGKVLTGRFLKKRIIDLTQAAWVDPFLRLTPGEQTQFSCWFAVPHAAVCTVEVIIIGKRALPSWLTRRGRKRVWFSWLERGSKKVPQWRASAVSAPLSKAAA